MWRTAGIDPLITTVSCNIQRYCFCSKTLQNHHVRHLNDVSDSSTFVKFVQKLLQEDFQRVDEWLKSMDLITNLKKGKTECMMFVRYLTENQEQVVENPTQFLKHNKHINLQIPWSRA